jgi:hypothetical protein
MLAKSALQLSKIVLFFLFRLFLQTLDFQYFTKREKKSFKKSAKKV